MKSFFINNSIKIITNYNKNYNQEELEKLKYGLEGIYLTITKTIIIILLGILFNIITEILIITLAFNLLRYFAFGFHAKESLDCLIFWNIIYFIFNVKIKWIYKLIIAILCTIVIMIFAPADTIKRPLPNKKKRIIRKLLSTVISILYTVTIITANNFISNALLCAIIIQTINVNPITYMIFKQPFNNYKTLTTD